MKPMKPMTIDTPAKRPAKRIVANWKMHLTVKEALSFISELKKESFQSAVSIAPPYTAIYSASSLAQGTAIAIGAQNMHQLEEGAYTGEISARQIQEAGATFVILGHSERRRLYQESDELINLKVREALKKGIAPILCVGETLQQRQEGKTQQVLEEQLEKGLMAVASDQLSAITLAYEPVWAIGTGESATAATAAAAHAFCRSCISKLYGSTAWVPILYGGSVSPETAPALCQEKEIDGFLVGGASLKIGSFLQIIAAADKLSASLK